MAKNERESGKKGEGFAFARGIAAACVLYGIFIFFMALAGGCVSEGDADGAFAGLASAEFAEGAAKAGEALSESAPFLPFPLDVIAGGAGALLLWGGGKRLGRLGRTAAADAAKKLAAEAAGAALENAGKGLSARREASEGHPDHADVGAEDEAKG